MNGQQIERRNILSSFFITVLLSMGYQEMILVVRDEITPGSFQIESLLLPATFFFVSMRFFVGNQLHLLSDLLASLPGLVWLYDLMVIVAQSVVIILLGSATSSESIESAVKFIDLMIILYAIDVFWIVSQWLVGRIVPDWRRPSIPWAWALLNSGLIVVLMVQVSVLGDRIVTPGGLWGLLGLNVAGFIVDVVLVDYYDVI